MLIKENISYTWVLKDFKSLDLKKSNESPAFPKLKDTSKWKLNIHSEDSDDNIKYLGIFLVPDDILTGDEITADYTVSILNWKDKIAKKNEMSLHIFKKPFIGFGFPTFIKMDVLNQYVTDDELKIREDIKAHILESDSSYEIEYGEWDTITKLKDDYGSLLEQSDFSDFVIKIEKNDIPVHKTILAGRSPVFAAMIKNDTSEKQLGFVEIEDVDKVTMETLLQFLNTSEVKISNDEDAIKLLIAADKYEILDLKRLCEKHLIQNLNVDDVMNALIIADRHNASILKKKAICYVAKNIRKFNTSEFQKACSNPQLLIEIISEISNLSFFLKKFKAVY